MKLYTILVAALLLLVGRLSLAQYPVNFVDDNFDSYADQAAFDAVWLPAGTTTDPSLQSAELSTAQSVTSPNSVNVPVSTTATLSSTEYVSRHTFTDTISLFENEKLFFSFDFRETGFFGNPQRNYARLQDTTAPTGNNQLVAMGCNNNLFKEQDGGNYYMARILGYTPTYLPPTSGPANPTPTSGAFFKLNDPGAPPRTANNVWHNLKVELSSDGENKTDYRFYVDNILAKTVLDVGTTLRGYDNIAIGSGVTNGSNGAFFDNMKLELHFVQPVTNTADFNGDGTIDAADYVVWRKNNGLASGATQSTGDANGDGDVDDDDYLAWREGFGTMPGSGSGLGGGAVPEPSTVALLMIGLAAMAARRRSR